MKQKLFNVLMFTAGAAIGSLVTWKFVKTKYERIAQEEIDSVKETWVRMAREDSGSYDTDDISEEEDDVVTVEYDPVKNEYHRIVNKYSSAGDDAENGEEGEGDDVPYVDGPYVITPDDFADGNYDHEAISLTYFADGILANDWFETFDIDDTIGEKALEQFEDDVVHVRNKRLLADYEVVRDPRNYADVVADDPLMSRYAN